jgi:hypothetical protein
MPGDTVAQHRVADAGGAINRLMASAGVALTETPIDASLQDGSAYRGRLLHYRRA